MAEGDTRHETADKGAGEEREEDPGFQGSNPGERSLGHEVGVASVASEPWPALEATAKGKLQGDTAHSIIL